MRSFIKSEVYSVVANVSNFLPLILLAVSFLSGGNTPPGN